MAVGSDLAVMPQVFTFEENEVRVVIKDGEPWWVLADVCKVLVIANSRDAASRLDDSVKGDVGLTDTIGRLQQTTAVSEEGLYEVIVTSRKPEAKAFKKRVFGEVLPQIRKTGSYGQPALPMGYEEALEQLLSKERERKALAAQVERNAVNTARIKDIVEGDALLSKCDYVNRALRSNQDLEVPLGEAAAVLSLPFGRNRLYDILRAWGWVLQDSTVPSSYARDNGWLIGKETLQCDKYGKCHRHTVAFATLKGRLRILRELISRRMLTETKEVACIIAELKQAIREYESDSAELDG